MVVSWPKIAWLYGTLVPVVLLGPLWFDARALGVGLGLAFATTALGHSVGLHRGIIHRSYETSPALRGALALVFVLTGLGGPLTWLRVHALRDHHQRDPQAPRTFRFLDGVLVDYHRTMHLTWRVDDWSGYPVRREDLEDPWLQWLERHWRSVNLLQAGALAAIGGLPWVLWAGCFRVALVQVGHWFVGWVAHTRGYQRYRIPGVAEEGFNTWLLGVLSLGEGFHNNHHAKPRSARHGHVWWEIDIGWGVIWLLERLGLVWNVQRPEELPVAGAGAALDGPDDPVGHPAGVQPAGLGSGALPAPPRVVDARRVEGRPARDRLVALPEVAERVGVGVRRVGRALPLDHEVEVHRRPLPLAHGDVVGLHEQVAADVLGREVQGGSPRGLHDDEGALGLGHDHAPMHDARRAG